MGARIAAEGLPLTVIARPHNDSATNTLIDSIRQRNGMVVISREDVRSALRTLRNNQILGILPDQHAGRSGIPILFFGRPASTFPGIAALAIRSGAPIIPGFAVRQPDGTHLVTISPPLKLLSGNDSQETVRSNTTLCTKVIEEQIKLHPDHWLWFHNRWKS
jgi:KDO2-lipid IV(A) lauroyltransferase